MICIEECSIRLITCIGLLLAWFSIMWIVYKIGKIEGERLFTKKDSEYFSNKILTMKKKPHCPKCKAICLSWILGLSNVYECRCCGAEIMIEDIKFW